MIYTNLDVNASIPSLHIHQRIQDLSGSVTRYSHATNHYSILSFGMNKHTMVEYVVTESRCSCIANEPNPIQICPVTPPNTTRKLSFNIDQRKLDQRSNRRPRRSQKDTKSFPCRWEKQKRKLLSLGSNQKPSGCLDLAVITAERATNCATEDVGANTLLDEGFVGLYEYKAHTVQAARIVNASNVPLVLDPARAHSRRQTKKITNRTTHNAQRNTSRTNPIPLNERISTVTSSSFFLIGLSQHHTSLLSQFSAHTLLLIGLGTMLAGLSSDLLVQDLRLVHPR